MAPVTSIASDPAPVHFWLRDEVKPDEHRTALLPEHCAQLLEKGYKITVERSSDRCVGDEEYEKAGCSMVASGSWKTDCPKDAIVFGLKELPEDGSSLEHTHIYFGHCFKGQDGWAELLKRFIEGNGTLYDLEFLLDERGRRVAAFGICAGFVGMALGLRAWALQQENPASTMPPVTDTYRNWDELVSNTKQVMKECAPGKIPRVLILGALGRCGSGAVNCAEMVGIQDIARWDLAETKCGGPFKELRDYDVVINCIYLTQKIPPFLTKDLLEDDASEPRRALSVLVDVSCDPNNINNPLPVYTATTTFADPVVRTVEPRGDSKPLDVIAIDHLPSMVPLESSKEFTGQLFPHLLQFPNSPVWNGALNFFRDRSSAAAKLSTGQ